jgi:hypothetical protein
MSKVKIEDVVYHLSSDFKKALEDTFQEFAPNASIDRNEVFRFFLRRVYKHCRVWEEVPATSVEV